MYSFIEGASNGWPTPAHGLQWRCGYSLGTGREKFRVARALPELPLIRETLGDPADDDPLHDVSAETFHCKWDGRRPDYGTMVELLDALRRPRPPD